MSEGKWQMTNPNDKRRAPLTQAGVESGTKTILEASSFGLRHGFVIRLPLSSRRTPKPGKQGESAAGTSNAPAGTLSPLATGCRLGRFRISDPR
jgi:hypothetical protein